MRIFLTGATGYIGSAVARTLRGAGHEVVGLTRSADKVAALEKSGVHAFVGDLKKPTAWRAAADGCDILIHTGFEMSADGPAADKTALQGMIDLAKADKSPRLIIYTSGVWVLGHTAAPADEEAALNPIPLVQWRAEHEKLALSAAAGSVSVAIIRPGCVYGGRQGLYGGMIESAVKKGSIKLVGDGANCWAGVHVKDLARLYWLVAERRPHEEIYHASDGAHEPLRDVAEAILKASGHAGKAATWPLDEARKTLGPFADALALDQRISSDKARHELGWSPGLSSVIKNAPRLVADWKANIT